MSLVTCSTFAVYLLTPGMILKTIKKKTKQTLVLESFVCCSVRSRLLNPGHLQALADGRWEAALLTSRDLEREKLALSQASKLASLRL